LVDTWHQYYRVAKRRK